MISKRWRQHAGTHDDALRAGTQGTKPGQGRWGVAIGVLPRLEVVAHENRIKAGLLRVHRELEKLLWRKLFRRCLVAEFQDHRPALLDVGGKLPPWGTGGNP